MVLESVGHETIPVVSMLAAKSHDYLLMPHRDHDEHRPAYMELAVIFISDISSSDFSPSSKVLHKHGSAVPAFWEMAFYVWRLRIYRTNFLPNSPERIQTVCQ